MYINAVRKYKGNQTKEMVQSPSLYLIFGGINGIATKEYM